MVIPYTLPAKKEELVYYVLGTRLQISFEITINLMMSTKKIELSQNNVRLAKFDTSSYPSIDTLTNIEKQILILPPTLKLSLESILKTENMLQPGTNDDKILLTKIGGFAIYKETCPADWPLILLEMTDRRTPQAWFEWIISRGWKL